MFLTFQYIGTYPAMCYVLFILFIYLLLYLLFLLFYMKHKKNGFHYLDLGFISGQGMLNIMC